MFDTLKRHWPEYLIEAAGLGVFMVSACTFTVLLEHPASPLRHQLPDAWVRRALMGLAMGLTAVAIIYSPWGKRSGAHINPAVSLTFWRLGKLGTTDALFYVLFQFLGAVAGVLVASSLLLGAAAHPVVNFAPTVPGPAGARAAFVAEWLISFGLMLAVLLATNARRFNRYTGLLAGTLVALYIAVEGPLSGMSMNPARSFGSAVQAGLWTSLWIYFVAPPLGMLVAAELYRMLPGRRVLCAKLHHDNLERCIFRCQYDSHDGSDRPAEERGEDPRGDRSWVNAATTT